MPVRNTQRTDIAVSASIVTADMLSLGAEFERVREAGVQSMHLDLEDGHFVPVMNLGTRLIQAAVQWGKLPVEVHLMVEHPEHAIALMNGLRLQSVSIHAESTRYPRRVLRMIREHGWKASIAFNPASPITDLELLMPYLDNVLILTTEPETGAAPFLEACLPAIREAVIAAHALGVSVTVDGGVDTSNIEILYSSGVDTVVMGRALFDSTHMKKTVMHINKGGTHE